MGMMQIDEKPVSKMDGWAWAVILRDVAGSGNLTSSKLYGSVAYHQLIRLLVVKPGF